MIIKDQMPKFQAIRNWTNLANLVTDQAPYNGVNVFCTNGRTDKIMTILTAWIKVGQKLLYGC